MGFGENNILLQKHIDIIYKFRVWLGGLHGPPYIFRLLFKKTEKVQEHDLY